MITRTWDTLGDSPSLLGFGCMRFPLKDPADPASIDVPAARELIRRAWEGGVNYFDTAWPYHGGRSEAFLGEALGEFPRDSYYLATKIPTWEVIRSRRDAEEIFSQQLERCRTDHFDFYLMHNLNRQNFENVQKIGLFDLLARKKDEGKIRHIGFSFHDTPAMLERIVDTYPWDFAQIQLNYLDWTLLGAKKQYEILHGHHIPVAVMEPVRGGMLARVGPDSAALMRQAAPARSQASWALRFAASLPGVMVVLSGMGSMEQVHDNLETFEHFAPLDAAECRLLEQVAENLKKVGAIPCTGCRYCADCPQGVNIPKIFAIYNQFCMRKEPVFFRNDYRTIPEEEQAHHCIQCGFCEAHCPQRIPIIRTLREIDQEAAPLLGRSAADAASRSPGGGSPQTT